MADRLANEGIKLRQHMNSQGESDLCHNAKAILGNDRTRECGQLVSPFLMMLSQYLMMTFYGGCAWYIN